jgi:hypothetical protein
MHKALTGRPWRTAPTAADAASAPRPTLTLRVPSKVRAGARVTVRWTATAAGSVAKWRVSLDGRVVKSLPATVEGVSRRMARPGRHVWRVVGFDATGAKVVAAKRATRVSSAR